MILSDGDIRAALQTGRLRIDPMPADDCIQPSSVDIHLSNRFLCFAPDQLLDTRKPPLTEEAVVPEGEPLWMAPGSFWIASTIERLTLPADMAARLEGKSTLARDGLIIESAGFIDPGFNGTLTLELANISGRMLRVWPGDPIGQLSFHPLSNSAQRPYGTAALKNKYQHQDGPTASRSGEGE